MRSPLGIVIDAQPLTAELIWRRISTGGAESAFRSRGECVGKAAAFAGIRTHASHQEEIFSLSGKKTRTLRKENKP
jgi:hypothetical protein